MSDTVQTGFWVQVGRPVTAWLLACFACGFLVAGLLTVNLLRADWLHLHEIPWLSLLSGDQGGLLVAWTLASASLAILTSVPILVFVLIARYLLIPRGFADVAFTAFAPYFLITGLAGHGLAGYGLEFGSGNPWRDLIDLVPIGAIGGLIYWLGAGMPGRRQA